MESDDDSDECKGKKAKATKRKNNLQQNTEDKYRTYIKPNYKRQYPDNQKGNEFNVYIESTIGDKLGNKNPFTLSKLFQKEIKGIIRMTRFNANKIIVTFNQHNYANNLINNEVFLKNNNIKAYIPAQYVEKIGVLRFVPTDVSNKTLFQKLSSEFEIISVKRFMKKTNNVLTPLQTVSIVFLTDILPSYVYLDMWRFKVSTYIPPLLQCYKCLRFNHSTKICNGSQKCSQCAGDHLYKECSANIIKCANCGGSHLAISKECPIKQQKILEKKNKISYSDVARININKMNFPTLPSKEKLVEQTSQTSIPSLTKYPLINNNEIMNDNIIQALIKTLVDVGNKKEDNPITTEYIKEKLLINLKHFNNGYSNSNKNSTI